MNENLRSGLRKLNKKLKEKKPLSPNEVKILRALYHTKLSLSKYEIAKKADVSWGTVKNRVPKLRSKKLIIPKPKNQFSFNFDLMLGKKPKKKRRR